MFVIGIAVVAVVAGRQFVASSGATRPILSFIPVEVGTEGGARGRKKVGDLGRIDMTEEQKGRTKTWSIDPVGG